MTNLSVTTYIQESSLPGYNLFPLTSNLFCLNLAQLLKTWLNSLAGLPLTGHFSATQFSSCFLARLSVLLTFVAFEI